MMRLITTALSGAILVAAARGTATPARGAMPPAGGEVSTTQPGSLIAFDLPAWRAGERGRVTATKQVALAVRGVSGGIIWEGQAMPDVPATIAVDRPGYYTLTATAPTGEGQTATFAVVPAPRATKPGPQIWGVNTHFGQRAMPDGAYPMLKLMNVDAVRDEFGWRGVEREAGVFDFSRHQPWADKLKENGIGLLWVAGYNNHPVYGGAPDDRYPLPARAAEFGRYCAEGLKRLGNNVIAIEVLNEPNKIDAVTRYLPLLKGTHAAIRAAGLKHEIVSVGGAGIGGGMNPAYAAKLFEAGGADFCDSFSSHPYMAPSTPDAGYGANANLDMACRRGAELATKYGQKGFWITEVGWTGPRPDDAVAGDAATRPLGTRQMVPAMKQAAFTARTLLGASKYPSMRGLFIYDFQDDGHDPTRREHRFGLTRQDLTPKPGFLAYAVAADFLKDKTFLRRVHEPDGLLSANLYRDGDGNVWAAVWAQEISNAEQLANAQQKREAVRPMDRETTARFRVRPADAKVVATDWQGAPVDAAAELTATNLPMYLNLGKADPAAATIELAD